MVRKQPDRQIAEKGEKCYNIAGKPAGLLKEH